MRPRAVKIVNRIGCQDAPSRYAVPQVRHAGWGTDDAAQPLKGNRAGHQPSDYLGHGGTLAQPGDTCRYLCTNVAFRTATVKERAIEGSRDHRIEAGA